MGDELKTKPGKAERSGSAERASVARWVLGAATGAILGLTVALIWKDKDTGEGAKMAFTMIIPLIGTWVGTVLAYYFSGENFERASQSVSKLVDQVLLDKLKSVPVKEAMIPRSSMKCVTLPPGDDGSGVNLVKDVIPLYEGIVTRLPVLDDKGAIKYVIHQSLIYRFITRKAIEMKAQSQNLDVGTQTLKDFLDYGDMRDTVSKSIAVVSVDSTLADAKTTMESAKNCQDIIVTETGAATAPVIGWLTNVDIAKRARL